MDSCRRHRQNTEIFTYALQGIESGGTAEDTVIRDKGIQWIYAGGTSRNTKIQNGGIVYLQAGGNLSGQTEFSGGTLNILGSNAIFDLSLDNSTVNFVRGSSFSSLNIKNLNGRGRFYLNSNLSQNQSDHINIENGDGSFGLVIHDYSMESSLLSEFKIIDEAAGAHDSFYLVGNAVDIGAFHYNLREENGNWVLVRTEQLTDTSLIAKTRLLPCLRFSTLTSVRYTTTSAPPPALPLPKTDYGSKAWAAASNSNSKTTPAAVLTFSAWKPVMTATFGATAATFSVWDFTADIRTPGKI